MTVYYFDSSAVVKLYLPEIGSDWMTALLSRPDQDRFVSIDLLTVEVACALARARRSARISTGHCEGALIRFTAESGILYRLLAVSDRILLRATMLAQRHPLRAYDAIHLAAALDAADSARAAGMAPFVLISADADLLAVARVEGLETENPNDHP
jgi:hypothetical protein